MNDCCSVVILPLVFSLIDEMFDGIGFASLRSRRSFSVLTWDL